MNTTLTMILTPTKGRPEAFRLLADCAKAQLGPRRLVMWVVAEDGTEGYSRAYSTITVAPLPGTGHSLCRNLLAALEEARHSDICVVAEDDDWYSSDYLTRLLAQFDADPDLQLCGFAPAFYLHAPTRSWVCCGNGRGSGAHCSLGMTAFRRSLIPTVRALCERGKPFIDVPLWRTPGVKSKILMNRKLDGTLHHLGMKGLPGEPGIGRGHQRLKESDPDLKWARAVIGDDIDRYAALCAGKVGA